MDGISSYDDYCDRIEGNYLEADAALDRAFYEAHAPRCKDCGETATVRNVRGVGFRYDRCPCTDTVVS